MSLILAAMMIVAMIPLGLAGSAVAIYTVTFDTQGSGTAPAPISVAGGESLSTVLISEDDVNLGSSGTEMFAGWSLKKNGAYADLYDLESPVNGNLTLYPVWVPAIDSVASRISADEIPTAGKPIPEDVNVRLSDADAGKYEVYQAFWVLAENGTPAVGTFKDGKCYYLRVLYSPIGDRLFRDNDGHYNNITLAMKSAVLDTGKGAVNSSFNTGSKFMATSNYFFAVGDVTTHTVSFDPNGHGIAPAPITVPHGWTLDQILDGNVDVIYNNMFADGYVFNDWYNYDLFGENPFDPYGMTVLGDVPLRAEWDGGYSAIESLHTYIRTPRVGDLPADLYHNGEMAAIDPSCPASIDGMWTYYERADGAPFDLFSDKFEENVTYVLVMSVRADENHYFAGGTNYYGSRRSGHLNVTVNGEIFNYAPTSYDEFTVTFKYYFVPTPKNVKNLAITDLTLKVEAPFVSERVFSDSFKAIPTSDNCVLEGVSWYAPDPETEGGYYNFYAAFEYGVTYKFEAFIMAKEGFGFPTTVKASIASGAELIGVERISSGVIKVTGTLTPRLPFTDVPEKSWYTDAVGLCYSWGLMSGTSSTTFSPAMKLTRAMFVTILSKLDGANTFSYVGNSFTDVREGEWYSKPIEWAYRNGYASGIGNGKFGPNDHVTREQLAQFFYNYSKIKTYGAENLADLSKYTDVSRVSDWALTAVRWAVGNGLISGTSATALSPKATASRAEVAVIILKYLKNIVAPLD